MRTKQTPADDAVAELAARACGGDQAAVAELYRIHYPRVLGFLRARIADRAVAEDLTQETFVRMLTGLHRYNPPPGAKFRTWLFTIAERLWIDRWRGSKRALEFAGGAPADLAMLMPAAMSPEGAVLRRMECVQLLSSMPARKSYGINRSAAAAVMTQAYGFTVAETAAQLGIPEGTVKSRTRRALMQMARAGGSQ